MSLVRRAPNPRAPVRCGLAACCALMLCASSARAGEHAISATPLAPITDRESDIAAPPLVTATVPDASPPPAADPGPSFSAGASAPGQGAASALEAPRIVRSRGLAPRAGVMVGFGGPLQPVRADLLLRLHGLFAIGGSVGGIPGQIGQSMLALGNVQNGSLTSLSYDGSLLLFPTRSSFFLGASFGRLTLSSASVGANGTMNVEARETYVTPRLGWLATWDSGFSVGFDAGVQVPLASAVTTTGTNTRAVNNADTLVRTLTGLPLPTIGVRLGWML